MYRRILVPVDGSDTAKRGLEEAINLADTLESELRIVHIVDDSALALNPETGVAAAPLVEDFAENGRQILEEARTLATKKGTIAGIVLHENFTGRVSDLIVDEAKKWGAELIVMGTHGHAGLRHAIRGSDAEAVVQGSICPVLLVRSPRPSKKK
jgi:nucleotide-binding universal stress UspA family protein